MSHVAPPNLGNVIPNGLARKLIYGIYTAAAVVVGGTAAYFLGIGQALPEVVVGAQAVVAYLAIPVGGLALVNTPSRVSELPADIQARFDDGDAFLAEYRSRDGK